MKNLIKPVYKCPESFKDQFKHSRCLLTISVGQEVHEGEKFEATIELINSSFESCIMLIDDSLQRHTMAIEKNADADYFYVISLKEGDEWLIRNEKTYSKLKHLEKIIRWDKWLQHSNFLTQKSKVLHLMKNEPAYKIAFDKTVDEFLRRYFPRLSNPNQINPQKAHTLCMDYLIEECAAFTLWPELNCNFEVYPSFRNLAMQQTYEHFILPTHPNLLHPVAIKFKNRKQLLPQQFKFLTDESTIA